METINVNFTLGGNTNYNGLFGVVSRSMTINANLY